MRYELKSISIWSFVKISFFLNLILGFVIGFFYAAFMGLFLSVAGNSRLADEWGMNPDEMSLGVLFILLPLLFGILGAFFQTLLLTFIVGLYNLFSRMTGGLILNLAEVNQTGSPGSQSQPMVSASAKAVPPVRQVKPPPPPPYAAPGKVVEPMKEVEPVKIEPAAAPTEITKPAEPKPQDDRTEKENPKDDTTPDEPPKW